MRTENKIHAFPSHRTNDFFQAQAPSSEVDGGGGGGHDGGMEARVAKLESTVEYIQRDISEIKTDIREIKNHARSDFRVLFGALIVGILGLAGIMAKGFNWIS